MNNIFQIETKCHENNCQLIAADGSLPFNHQFLENQESQSEVNLYLANASEYDCQYYLKSKETLGDNIAQDIVISVNGGSIKPISESIPIAHLNASSSTEVSLIISQQDQLLSNIYFEHQLQAECKKLTELGVPQTTRDNQITWIELLVIWIALSIIIVLMISGALRHLIKRTTSSRRRE